MIVGGMVGHFVVDVGCDVDELLRTPGQHQVLSFTVHLPRDCACYAMLSV